MLHKSAARSTQFKYKVEVTLSDKGIVLSVGLAKYQKTSAYQLSSGSMTDPYSVYILG